MADGISVAPHSVGGPEDDNDWKMSMKNLFLEALRKDHDEIRNRLNELKAALLQNTSDEAFYVQVFRNLKAVAIAHAKAEELALYALVEEPGGPQEHFAFEGYEEHDLMEYLMKEMSTSEEPNPQFRAQFKVLGDMLERHFLREELEFFPEVSVLLDEATSEKCIKVYLAERDSIYAKRMGSRPAISQASPLHH